MDAQPHPAPDANGRGPVPATARPVETLFLDRVLTLAALALLWYGAFWPIFAQGPLVGLQPVTVLVMAAAALGGIILPRGSLLALAALWAAFGMAAALGVIGIFSVGYVYLGAALLLLLAIFAMPNRSGVPFRYERRFIAAFYIGFLLIFLPSVIVALR